MLTEAITLTTDLLHLQNKCRDYSLCNKQLVDDSELGSKDGYECTVGDIEISIAIKAVAFGDDEL